MKILCSGYLVRHPLGGHAWHDLQYLAGFARLGHEVVFFEDYGWPDSCYNPAENSVSSDPGYGIAYLQELFRIAGLDVPWCYLSEDGRAHGMERERLAQYCRECDVYLNLNGINWIRELKECRRRVLVDADPVFTQIKVFGMGGDFDRYGALFTYGENVHRPGCTMPTGGARWRPTRQPIVTDFWPVAPGQPSAPFTTVTNWTATGEHEYEGRVFGQKDREFGPYYALPNQIHEPMEIALNAPPEVKSRFRQGGWRLADPVEVTRTPFTYQDFLARSRAEFSVAKGAYVITRSGWFSDRTCGYLAMGRPAVVQDTGFSDFLPCGEGLLCFRDPPEAIAAIQKIQDNYDEHCRAARKIVQMFFDYRLVLPDLLADSI